MCSKLKQHRQGYGYGYIQDDEAKRILASLSLVRYPLK